MAITRIVKEITQFEFHVLVQKYKGKIRINPHAYFRLNEMQRKIYKDETLIEILSGEKPIFIGVQQNNNYAAFFSRKLGYMRLIFKVTEKEIEIITFYITEHIPKV